MMNRKLFSWYRYDLRIRYFGVIFLISFAYFTISDTTAVNYPAAIPKRNHFKAIIPCPELAETWQPLENDGCLMTNQGILIETLDGGCQLAAVNENQLFNPASALKLATSLAALEKWGPAHRFRTAFYADGFIDCQTHTLNGDLILYSEGDPTFRVGMAAGLIKKLMQLGIRQVTGNLIINGPFSINSNFDGVQSAQRVLQKMQRLGLRIKGDIWWEKRTGHLLLSHYSKSLLDIIWFQNAHSSNPIAERLGDALGGTEALTLYLIQYVGLELEEILITHTSGLDYNRITLRGMLKILRKLYQWCQQNDVAVEKILPAAGVDPSTVTHRFHQDPYRGGILAKTGTLLETDCGVSALVGFIQTPKYGLLVFALFNTHGDVLTYQRWQNTFLKALVDRSGGVIPFKAVPEAVEYVYGGNEIVPHFQFAGN